MSISRALLSGLLLGLVVAGCGTQPTQPVAAAAPASSVEKSGAAELRDFAQAVRASFLSKDLDRFMDHFHEDFRDDGKDKAAQREYLRNMVLPYVEKWEYRIEDAKIDGDKAVVKAIFITEWGKFPGDGELIRQDGRWLWYGNRN